MDGVYVCRHTTHELLPGSAPGRTGQRSGEICIRPGTHSHSRHTHSLTPRIMSQRSNNACGWWCERTNTKKGLLTRRPGCPYPPDGESVGDMDTCWASCNACVVRRCRCPATSVLAVASSRFALTFHSCVCAAVPQCRSALARPVSCWWWAGGRRGRRGLDGPGRWLAAAGGAGDLLMRYGVLFSQAPPSCVPPGLRSVVCR